MLDQVFQFQLAAALQVDPGTAAGACNLQRCPLAVERINCRMSHHPDELTQVGEVVRDGCAGKHVTQVELVAVCDVEWLG